MKDACIDPAPERAATTWATFLRSPADALLACDFLETVTLSGQRQHILAVIEHTTRRVRIPGATAHPTAAWVTQAARNLVMDLEDAGATVKYLIRDRDGKFPAMLNQVLTNTGIEVMLTAVRMHRMNSTMERWNQTCRHELLDRVLIWNHAHLLHTLRQFEIHYNTHRTHQSLHQGAPLRPKPQPIAKHAQIIHLDIRRHDRPGGTLHEYHHAA